MTPRAAFGDALISRPLAERSTKPRQQPLQHNDQPFGKKYEIGCFWQSEREEYPRPRRVPRCASSCRPSIGYENLRGLLVCGLKLLISVSATVPLDRILLRWLLAVLFVLCLRSLISGDAGCQICGRAVCIFCIFSGVVCHHFRNTYGEWYPQVSATWQRFFKQCSVTRPRFKTFSGSSRKQTTSLSITELMISICCIRLCV